MKKKTFKGKEVKDLKEQLADKAKRLSAFRSEASTGKVKNVKEGREIRKDIARILTELNAKA